jgi:hypothetical protein
MIEDVAITYPAAGESLISNSTASMTIIGSAGRNGISRYIRVWVYNRWGFPAHNCQVFVKRILVDGKILEPEKSPLHWSDEKGKYEWPFLRRGHENGHWIDVCACDSVTGIFEIISQKRLSGYHRYNRSGTYRIELSAEAVKPCRFGEIALTVKYDNSNWRKLMVIGTEEKRVFINGG